MKSKRIFTFSIISVILFSLVIFFPGCGKDEPDVIKVGAILPLSGNLSVIGEPERKSIEVFRKTYPDSRIKILIEDSQGDPKQTISIVNRLANVEGVRNFIISTSPSILSAIPIIKNYDGMLFAITSTPDISDGENIFQICPNSRDEMLALVNWMGEQSIDSVAFVYPNNEFGTMIWDLFSKNYDGTITFSEAYQLGASDFRSLLLKIKSKNPSWISFQGYPNDIPTFIKQAREMGINSKFITSLATTWPSTLNSLVKLGETPVFMSPIVMLETERTSKADLFYKSFLENSDEKPNWDAYYVFEVLQILDTFSTTCDTCDTNELKSYLLNTQHKTISDTTEINKDGSTKIKLIPTTIKDGKIIRFIK